MIGPGGINIAAAMSPADAAALLGCALGAAAIGYGGVRLIGALANAVIREVAVLVGGDGMPGAARYSAELAHDDAAVDDASPVHGLLDASETIALNSGKIGKFAGVRCDG